MDTIKTLTSVLEGGEIPERYNKKAIGKLIKTWKKLENPKVVHLYPLRRITYDGSHYCVYACPLNSYEIDEQTLQNIRSLVNELEIGYIRFDAFQPFLFDFDLLYDVNYPPSTKEKDREVIKEISDYFAGIALFTFSWFSSKADRLNCYYAIVGTGKEPNEYSFKAIVNSTIGKSQHEPSPTSRQLTTNKRLLKIEIPDEEEQGAPAATKFNSAMGVLSAIIMIGLLIWYFLAR